jgi:hypothetical protein
MTSTLETERYPVGRFQPPRHGDPERRAAWAADIAALPTRLRSTVSELTDSVLETPYREGGWTVRQVVHHLADSHVNGYIRFTLATTEDDREALLYDQDRWAAGPFATAGPIEPSLILLDGLHARWAASIRGLPDSAWSRSIRHAEWGEVSVDFLVALYAWHGRHHVAHIDRTVARGA